MYCNNRDDRKVLIFNISTSDLWCRGHSTWLVKQQHEVLRRAYVLHSGRDPAQARSLRLQHLITAVGDVFVRKERERAREREREMFTNLNWQYMCLSHGV